MVYDEIRKRDNMRKRNLIVIPLLVIVGLIIALLVVDSLQTPGWKLALNHYISYLRETGHPEFRLQSSAIAAQPGNFTFNMSTESFSESIIFQTTYNTNAQLAVDLAPMPYPPDEVVCALLKGDTQQQLVYIALHNSLYNADWIVHISPDPWGSPAIQSSLDLLGCTLIE